MALRTLMTLFPEKRQAAAPNERGLKEERKLAGKAAYAVIAGY